MQQTNKKANMVCWLFKRGGGWTGAISNLEGEAVAGRPGKAAGISLIHLYSIKVSLACCFIKGVVVVRLRLSASALPGCHSRCRFQQTAAWKKNIPLASTYFLETRQCLHKEMKSERRQSLARSCSGVFIISASVGGGTVVECDI